jgi:glycosyltransferase involved in cell wall biosynthesis
MQDIKDFGLESRFFLLGFRQDVPQLLREFDVFVLSSTSEGFSLATIEAMATGIPVVVTKSGGPEEIVDDRQTGLMVPPADPASLAQGICEVLENPALARELAIKGQEKVASTFSLSSMVTKYEALYQSCAERN